MAFFVMMLHGLTALQTIYHLNKKNKKINKFKKNKKSICIS